MAKIQLACPRIHGFVYKIENVDSFSSDPVQKLIVYTLPSIWYYPFFQNDIDMVNRQNQENQNLCIELPIELLIELPIAPCGITGSWAGAGPGPDRVLGRTGSWTLRFCQFLCL